MQISLPVHLCLANMVGIKATLITFGDELAFHQRGLCMSGSAHITLAYFYTSGIFCTLAFRQNELF